MTLTHSGLYDSSPSDRVAALQDQVTECIDAVGAWMRSNRRQLNASKTEILWFASARRQDANHQIYHFSSGLTLAMKPVRCVWDLGIYIDAHLSTRTNISKTVSSCFAALRQIRSVRRSVSKPVLLSLVSSVVLSRLDYGSASATLAGVHTYTLDRLQSVQVWYTEDGTRPCTPLLQDLHWVSTPERIKFRLTLSSSTVAVKLRRRNMARDLHS